MGEGLGVMDPVSRPVTGPQLEHGQLEDLGTVISSVLGEPFVSDVAIGPEPHGGNQGSVVEGVGADAHHDVAALFVREEEIVVLRHSGSPNRGAPVRATVARARRVRPRQPKGGTVALGRAA